MLFATLLLAALPTPADLQAMPEVASVEVRAADDPSHRIIHILNWHYVSEKDFKAAGEKQDYESFLKDVEAIQTEQMSFLRRLKVREVHYEGMTEKNRVDYLVRCQTFKKYKKPVDPSPEQKFVADFVRGDMLQLGAPGKLLMAEEIDSVLPGDDAGAMKRAEPFLDGDVRQNKLRNQAREDATVRLLLKQKESVLIMGGAHDLADNLPKDVEYVRVTLKQYEKVIKKGEND